MKNISYAGNKLIKSHTTVVNSIILLYQGMHMRFENLMGKCQGNDCTCYPLGDCRLDALFSYPLGQFCHASNIYYDCLVRPKVKIEDLVLRPWKDDGDRIKSVDRV